MAALCGTAAADPIFRVAQCDLSRFTVRGRPAFPMGSVVEVVDLDVADELISRLFEEAGLHGARSNDPLSAVTSEPATPRWTYIDQSDFSSERVWGHFLDHDLGLHNHLQNNDPRARQNCEILTPEEESEVSQALAAAQPHLSATLVLTPSDLQATRWARRNQPPDAASRVADRAEALQRIEQQVREFLTYLQAQGE